LEARSRRSARNVPIVKRLHDLEARGKLLVEPRDLIAQLLAHAH
jgi:hypothetical protein